MSDKATCPACDATTSGVLIALQRGEPCPYCGLSAEVIEQLQQARARGANDELIERCAQAELRAERADAETVRVVNILARVQAALKEVGM